MKQTVFTLMVDNPPISTQFSLFNTQEEREFKVHNSQKNIENENRAKKQAPDVKIFVVNEKEAGLIHIKWRGDH